MSIHPQYAERLLDGSKRVEFRKRPLAPDVTTVLIYATMPVGQLVGAFEIDGYDISSPSAVWETHKSHAGITRSDFRRYFSGHRRAVGILVRDARRLDRPLPLSELDDTLRPPQSFRYLELCPWGSRSVPRPVTADMRKVAPGGTASDLNRILQRLTLAPLAAPGDPS
ncbi:MAG TPA: ASCH domain-containing protein [Propionicimonas sp.]|jgi:predicted transcriptional regulator